MIYFVRLWVCRCVSKTKFSVWIKVKLTFILPLVDKHYKKNQWFWGVLDQGPNLDLWLLFMVTIDLWAIRYAEVIIVTADFSITNKISGDQYLTNFFYLSQILLRIRLGTFFPTIQFTQGSIIGTPSKKYLFSFFCQKILIKPLLDIK